LAIVLFVLLLYIYTASFGIFKLFLVIFHNKF
jgi:hypothetical protein